MPREHKSRREVLDAIEKLPSIAELLTTHDGHYDYELDLEVVVYGRNYNGKKVGPYVRLLTYEPGEAVITEGDWGGNTFYIVVRGNVDVLVGGGLKVAELKPGTQFGEMSVLGGVPRNATVKARPSEPAQILEVQRPALRLLRKLSSFSETLDRTYRSHGRDATIEDLKIITGISPDMLNELKSIALFKVYSKNHVLFREGERADQIYIIKEGWLRRSAGDREDFLGRGYCFAAEGAGATWPFTVTLMGRTEALEISVSKLRQTPSLNKPLLEALRRFAPPASLEGVAAAKPALREQVASAQRDLINTGLVDATNLLVMDMDLCVRCGNCSLACHKIHGQSRLTRRGIHITRLTSLKPSAQQSALSPEVCLHCKDPECLTGCPTGAIGRFANGQIDINPATCIGCGDCAMQCPYNAISMISRKPQTYDSNGGFGRKLADLFRLKSDTLPPSVEATDDLLAVKCNLCTDRASLNPPASKTQVYSCEQNCPTGALARINPREYFTEIGEIEGLMVLNPTHATGRNIHKSDPPKRLIHTVGILAVAVITALALAGLARYGFGESLWGFLNMRWLTGLVGLAGIGAAMAYPARRQVYTKRRGPLRYWMLAHTYLGILAAVMILLHGGTSSGGMLTTLLMISFDLVIATGLFGVACYQISPRLLTKIEGSPLLLDDLVARREELKKEIAETLAGASPQLASLILGKVLPRFVSPGYLLRQYLKREALDRMIETARKEFQPLRVTLSSDRDRQTMNQAIEAAATLRRVDALVYLHQSLKLWLPPHVATTSIMLALMAVHIIQVIYYAAW